ncbi:hypothetical protein BH09ACT10_BH09ACT10_24480 [soil metagenome]
MTRVDEFDSFYAMTARSTLQLTYALCGDRNIALDATADAYRHSWRNWKKISAHDPHAYTRSEAWHLTTRERAAHLLRRRNEEDGDSGLLDALADLPVDGRRLLALMTLGNIDLDDAAREVGLSAEEAIEHTTEALTALERGLGESIDGIERRLQGLSNVSDALELPTADDLRSSAKRGAQRNIAVLVATSIAVVVASGLIVTPGSALNQVDHQASRQKIGAETPDQVLNASVFEPSQLLTANQVSRLDPTADWVAGKTDEDAKNPMPYATCPTTRFANPNPLRTFVRSYSGSKDSQERVAQAVEISKSSKEADASFHEMIDWFADCQHPRTQLVSTYRVERPTGDFQILRLRSNRSPVRTLTVGLSHSGTLALALVHEVDGTNAPAIEDFATTLNESVLKLCRDSGGICSRSFDVEKTIPPPIAKAPAFLGDVDLPPVANVDEIWQGTDPVTGGDNPAATVCDQTTFVTEDVRTMQSRIFVMPQATVLPPVFGIAETVAKFDNETGAKAYVGKMVKKMEACAKDNLTASLDQKSTIKSGDIAGRVWRLTLKINDSDRAYFRTAIVRVGNRVAQMTFTSTKDYDITQKDFVALAKRTGQRVTYLR